LVYGAGAAIDKVAKAWLGAGPTLVVITRSHKGAVAFTRDWSVERPGRRIDVIDTVGAGDSFHAAFLASLASAGSLTPRKVGSLSTKSLEQALEYAITASSITCSRRGADLPTRQEVEAAISR
jgi:fructokinase